MSASVTTTEATALVRLEGGWRVAGRVASALVALVALALVVASLPNQLTSPGTLCTITDGCASGQLNAEAAATLRQYGIGLQAYTHFTVALSLVYALAWFAAGALVLLRRADDRVALIVGIQAFTQGASNATGLLTDPHSFWYGPALVFGLVNQIALFYLFALFPNGRFVPRWLRWVALAWAAFALLSWLPGLDAISLPVFMAGMLLLIACQVYRFRVVSDAIQRQQTKLVVFAFVAMMAIIFLSLLPLVFDPALGANGSLYAAGGNIISSLALLLGPASITVAILRYRLFDIDILINRTLVYGSLTALLAGVYFGSVLVMQHLAIAFAGTDAGNNPLILVLSTLLIAALFQPLRTRLQQTIDRRFYRQKYDAAKALASFAATLRGEVDLADLEGHLVGVVEETMQPAHVSLWLRADSARKGGQG